jgi:hypothetical protein
VVVVRSVVLSLLASAAALLLAGCDVKDYTPEETGFDLGGAGAGGAGATCARGAAVVSSDYLTSNVSLLDLDGSVVSSSLISSGSAVAGLSLALGGDVALPTERVSGEQLVLLDRYPASVITWVDLQTAEVPAQLSVATGFSANPHDYVRISPTKAYVPRFEGNLDAGREQFDQGNDVVIVDPSVPEMTGRIDLVEAMAGEAARFLPRADRAVLAGGRAYVLLGSHSEDMLESTDSRIVCIDVAQDSLSDVLVLDGLQGCAGLALSPDATEFAVSCSGAWEGDSVANVPEAGVVRVGLVPEFHEIERYPAQSFSEGSVSTGISYADATHLVFTTYGRFAAEELPPADDTLIELDLDSGEFRVLLRSEETPFTLGDVRCDAACGVCFVTDAERDGGVVHRFEVGADGLSLDRAFALEPSLGLPPRLLGWF